MAASEEAGRRLTQKRELCRCRALRRQTLDDGGRSGIVQGLPYSLHHLEN
jgi:hypothetical protein